MTPGKAQNQKAPKTGNSAGNGAGPTGPARILYALTATETLVAVSALAVMTAIVFFDVLGRELVGQGIAGAQRIGVFAFVLAGFLGLPLATARGGHLRPKFADGLFPLPSRATITVIQHALAAIISLTLAWFGLSFARQTLVLQEVSPVLEIPIGLVQLVLPYAFLSSGLRHAIYAWYPNLAPNDDSGDFH